MLSAFIFAEGLQCTSNKSISIIRTLRTWDRKLHLRCSFSPVSRNSEEQRQAKTFTEGFRKRNLQALPEAQADLGHRPHHRSAFHGWSDRAAPAIEDPADQSSCALAFYWQESSPQWWGKQGTRLELGQAVTVLKLEEQNHAVKSTPPEDAAQKQTAWWSFINTADLWQLDSPLGS